MKDHADSVEIGDRAESDSLRAELRAYYSRRTLLRLGGRNYQPPNFALLDEYASGHPELNSYQLKAKQYEVIADMFTPVIFKHSPFYGEMGMKIAEYDGMWHSSGCWLRDRNNHLFRDIAPRDYDQYVATGKHAVTVIQNYPDQDHHCFPYSNVIANGLGKICEQAKTELETARNQEERDFLAAAVRGLLAVRKISGKFADAAAALLPQASDERERDFLNRIAQTAREVPWRKPETFYEGLAATWFLHEVSACLEGIGIAVIGHIDRMLWDLYDRDRSAGRITPAAAGDLIGRFLMHTDAKLDLSEVSDFYQGEQGDTLILGGCDRNGKEICNDLTFLTLKAYRELKLVNPKILCRISRHSDQALLDEVNRNFLDGRSVISFLNDDAIIPMQVKNGKRLEDARCYVAGGCWEPILEGFEHSAGANYYLYLPRILDMSIHEHPEIEADTGIVCQKIDRAPDFEAVYRIVMDNAIGILRLLAERIGKNGRIWPQVNPSPFFSACLTDCLQNRRDYTAGGGRYNPHAILLSSFAVFVDSLLAIKTLCFDTKHHPLSVLLKAVRADWEGYGALRAEVLAVPHFGDNREESNTLARRILNDMRESIGDLKNERGGPFVLCLINWREAIAYSKSICATPDGRRIGDYLTQGLTPSRFRSGNSITSVINSCAALDLRELAIPAVLTVSLPVNGMNLAILAQVERVFARSGAGVLQLNCVDKAVLLDARKHPERHQDLIVRFFGYSMRFVNLTAEFQDEFISRGIYS